MYIHPHKNETMQYSTVYIVVKVHVLHIIQYIYHFIVSHTVNDKSWRNRIAMNLAGEFNYNISKYVLGLDKPSLAKLANSPYFSHVKLASFTVISLCFSI